MRLQAGDMVFFKSVSVVSRLVSKVTFGKVSHVAIAYDEATLFETDGKWGKAMFTKAVDRMHKEVEVYRFKNLLEEQREEIQFLCHGFEGTPYSFLDIAVKGMTFWLHPKIAGQLASFVGNKKHMICNELVARIMYEVTGFEAFENVEGSNPQLMLEEVRQWPSYIEKVVPNA